MTDFSELLARALRGDERAIDTIYRNYGGLVRVAARRRLGPYLRRKLDSTDVVQSVFTDVLRDLPRFTDRGEGAFRRWLYMKATNKVTDKMRAFMGTRGRRVEQLIESDAGLVATGAGPGSQATAREDAEQASQLLGLLEPSSREVVRLRLEEALTFAQIAERLGLATDDAARKRYARAIRKIRDRWEE